MAKEVIKTSDVTQVAMLSRLEFNEKEIENLKQNLSEIVTYFGGLLEVDTQGVPEITKPEGKTRPDEVEKSLTPEKIVMNAPNHTSNAFIVPRVVE